MMWTSGAVRCGILWWSMGISSESVLLGGLLARSVDALFRVFSAESITSGF